MSYKDDLAAYGQALAENNLQYNMPDLYGFYAPGGPVAGQQTLAGSKLSGMFMNNPDLEAELAGGTFGPNMGYLAGKNTLDYGKLMGQLNGQNTLAAQEALGAIGSNPTLEAAKLYGNSGGAAGGGTDTLEGKQLNYQTALDSMKLLAGLSSNPFKMEAVARGMDQTGIPNALKGLMQGGFVPGFQANQAQPQAPGMASSLGIQGGAATTPQSGGPVGAAPVAPAPAQPARPLSFAQQAQNAGLDLNQLKGYMNQFGGPQGLERYAAEGFTGSTNGNTNREGFDQPYTGFEDPTKQPYFNFLRNYVHNAPDFNTAKQNEISGLQGMGGGPDSADPSSTNFDPAAAAGMNVDATTATAPSPNKLNAVNYQNGPKTMQDFIKSLYESMGYNPDTIDEETKAELPGFTAPRYGTVQA